MSGRPGGTETSLEDNTKYIMSYHFVDYVKPNNYDILEVGYMLENILAAIMHFLYKECSLVMENWKYKTF